jgi:hypothetical protein
MTKQAAQLFVENYQFVKYICKITIVGCWANYKLFDKIIFSRKISADLASTIFLLLLKLST